MKKLTILEIKQLAYNLSINRFDHLPMLCDKDLWVLLKFYALYKMLQACLIDIEQAKALSGRVKFEKEIDEMIIKANHFYELIKQSETNDLSFEFEGGDDVEMIKELVNYMLKNDKSGIQEKI